MICPNCKSRNPIGNKFCRECGAPLVLPAGSLAAEEAARVEAERTAEKSAALLVEAHALADVKKFDEAIALGEEAALLLPHSTSAHSLLATLYERTEQNDKAIAAMEKVVALNPESAADQIKLDQLRRGVHMLPRASSSASQTRLRDNAPLPWVPLVLAGGAMIAVLGAGWFWLNRAQTGRAVPPPPITRPMLPATPPPNAANPTEAAPQYVAPTPLYGGTTVPAPPPPTSEVRSDPFKPLQPSASPALRTAPRNNAPVSAAPPRPLAPVTVVPPPGAGGPNAGSAGSGGAAALPPIPASPPQTTGGDNGGNPNGSGPFPPAAPGFGTGGRIPAGPPETAPLPPGGGNQNAPSGSSGTNSSSYIHISVGGGNKSRSASGTGGSGEKESPLARARVLQQTGQYGEAIGAYRLAIANGSSAGSAFQGIAQCYESLNDPGGARNAYRDAIRAYSAQASGKGSAAALRGIASCKAALEVLGGG